MHKTEWRAGSHLEPMRMKDKFRLQSENYESEEAALNLQRHRHKKKRNETLILTKNIITRVNFIVRQTCMYNKHFGEYYVAFCKQ